MSEPIRAEWASGRRKFSVDLLLLLTGIASVMLSIVIGFQIAVEPRFGIGLGGLALIIPVWGLVAIALALALRRRPQSVVLKAVGIAWLVAVVAAVIWFAPSNA